MESKLFKKLFSMILVIAMVLSMCPTFVFAEGETAETEVDTTNPNYCPHCKTVLSDADWTDLGNYVEDSGNKLPTGHYRLYNDYTLPGNPLWFNTSATIVIDLAGHTLAPSEGMRPITVDTGRTLYLLNSAGDIDADGNVTGKVQGGSLVSSSASTYGGAIYVNGTLYMYGGTVTGGSIETTKATSAARYAYGGNIYIKSTGTMVMYGGTVTGGSVHTIHTYNKTTATESYSGSAAYGGNIYTEGSLTVEGGTISGGVATASANCPENSYCARGDFRGGNIYNAKDGLTINGGTITGGDAQRGGNIYSTKNMTVNDGLITLGTADRGGNIAISNSAKLSIYGGTISEGYMTWGGGNIFATDQTAAVYVYGGNITNTLKSGGSNGALIGTMYSNLFVFGGYFENTSTTYSMYTSSTGSSKLSKVEIYGGTFVQSTNWTGNASYTSVDIYNAIFIGKDAKFSQTAACATRTVTTAADGRDMYVYSQTLDADNKCATCGITYSAEACDHALTNQPGTALNTVSAAHPAIYFAPCEHCSPSADVAWVPMTDNHVEATHYYLPTDLQLESPVKVASNKTVCIDLNGKTITAPEGQKSFDVAGTLTVMDSQFNASIDENGELTGTAGKIVGSTVAGDYGNFKVAGGSANALATFNLLGGVIMNGDANFKDGGNDASAGNIMIGNAVVNINGGIVCGGSAEKYGGNIYVGLNGELNIDGGTIHGGHSGNLGGNVFATTGGVINMYSGTVSGGATETRGGNICLNTHGKFNMYGGTLKDGTADIAGANLAVCEGTATSDYATAKIFGGTISGGELLHYSRNCSLEIYNVTMDTDPSKSGYNGASAVADCADYCKVGDVYKVWHTGDDHAEEMALVADADKNSDIHDWADATCLVKSTCKNCGQTTGNFAEHIFDEETGACEYGCGTTACSGGHAAGEAKQEDVVNATCKEAGSYNLVTRCTRCNAIVTSEAKEIEKLPHVYDAETGICKNGCEKTYCENNDHTAGEAMQEEVVPATCQAAGSYKLVVRCTVCNEIQSSEDKTIDQLAHEYDAETGICKNGCSALAGAAVIQGEETTYYTNAIDALAAASGTGATVHIMKTVTVSMISKFNSYEKALKNVTITTAEGVSLKDNSGAAADNWYVNGITIGANASVFFDACPYFYGDNHIYGNADIYVTRINGTLTVHGDQGGYMDVERNMWVAGTLHIIGNGSDDVILNAGSHSGHYNLYGNHGGKLLVENAKIVCDDLDFPTQDGSSTFIFRNAKVVCEGITLDSSKDVFTVEGNTTITVSDAITSANTVITLASGSTITTTSADLQNTCIVAAEGVNGCVYYADGVYSVSEHTYPDSWTEGKKVCTNNCGATLSCEHTEYTLSGAEAATCLKPGYTGDKVCNACGVTFENGTDIEQKTHEYDANNVCINGCGKTKCENNNCDFQEIVKPENLVSAATCQAAAVYNKSCSVCGEKSEETFSYGEVDKNNHVEVKTVDAKAATCLEAGWDAYEYCTKCDYTTKVEQPKLEHNYTYKDNGDKTHTVTCDKGCNHSEVLPCADTDKDHYCDDCGAKLMEPVATVNGVEYGTLAEALEADGEVVLVADIEVAASGLTIATTEIINLNGKTLSSTGDIFVVVAGGDLTINGNGFVKAGTDNAGTASAIFVNGGKVTINGGTYSCGGDTETTDVKHQNDMIYVKGGSAEIYGGFFALTENVWALNISDSVGGTLKVYGGEFEGYDPAENVSRDNYLADQTKHTKKVGNVYSICENTHTSTYTAATFEADAYTTYTCVCGDTYTVTHEGTKKTAVATVNGEKFETLAEALAADGEVKLIADIDATASGVIVAAGEIIDLNGYKLTADIIGVTIKMNGGTFATSEYLMVGTTEGKYTSTDAIFTIAPNATMDMTIISGTITLNETLWYTLKGQTLTIEKDATFVIPAGKTLYVNGSKVVVNGTAANFGTLILADGAHLKGDVAGTFQMAGGTFETSKYVMIGATQGKYLSTDAVFTIAPNATMDMTFISGTVTLNETLWYTLEDQTLTVNEGAKFVIPAGKTLYINESVVVVNGEIEVEGNVQLTANATVAYADGTLADKFVTNEGDTVIYENGVYKVHNHSYATKVTDPTCTEKGYTTYTCTCGDEYVAGFVDETGHSHENIGYTDPTIEADGFWTYKCSCGDSYTVIDENTRIHVNVPAVDAEDIKDKIETEDTEATTEDIQEVIDNVVHGNDAVVDKDIFVDEKNDKVIEQMKQEKPELADKEPVLHITLQGMGVKTESGALVATKLVFDVTPMLGDTKIENLAAPLTFHLPVDNSLTGNAYVYHEGEFMGVYAIVSEGGNNYVVVSSQNFSEFTVEVQNESDVAINTTTQVIYTELQAALNAAAKGETVKLLKDVTAEDIYVGAGKTLDLNGFALTVTSSFSASFTTTHVIDSSNGEGLLVVAGADVALNESNKQLPVWTAAGVKFVEIVYKQIIQDVPGDADAKKFRFYFNVADDSILPTLLKEDCITIRVKVNYTTASGLNAYQYFELTDSLIDQYVNKWPNKTFDLTLKGVTGLSGLAFTAEIVSTAPSGLSVVKSSSTCLV